MKKRLPTTSHTVNKTAIGDGLVLVQLEDAAQPAFVEKRGKPYVLYGQKNDYPQYLLYLYNSSAKHSAIIDGKVDYICGQGWAVDGDRPDPKAEAFIKIANKDGESLDEITEKMVKDLELFDGTYVQVVWTRAGVIGSKYHVDYSKVRSNADNSEFYVSDEWVKYDDKGGYTPNANPKYRTFRAFNPRQRQGTQILYVKRYRPGIDIYTLPNYRGAITWIEVDIEIGNYHLSNVKSGFFANKLINMNNGIPAEEGQKLIERKFTEKFGGVRKQKFIIQFNQDATRATTIEDLNISESDKLFDQLNKTTQQEIFSGHRVTSPMLFGIKTEGQLGGRTELREASELFQNTYINNRQQWVEKVMNMLARFSGVTSQLQIKRTEPIAFEWSEAAQERVMLPEELRERMGLPPLEKKESDRAQDTINAINSLSPLVANKVLEKLTDDELRALIGLLPATGPVQPPQPAGQFSADDDARDAEIFGQFGIDRAGVHVARSRSVLFVDDDAERQYFSTLTGLEASVLDILIRDPLTTQQALATALDADLETIADALQVLEEEKLIRVTERRREGETVVERKPVKDAAQQVKRLQPETRSVEIMYSYEGPRDDRNRPFCAKMLALGRLYSRKDIEQISARLGYSVWARRGGWRTIPGSSPAEHVPYCRHTWKANVVVKRRS